MKIRYRQNDETKEEKDLDSLIVFTSDGEPVLVINRASQSAFEVYMAGDSGFLQAMARAGINEVSEIIKIDI